MNYFSQSSFENIRSKVLRLREKAASQRRIIVTTSAFPSDVTLDLAKMLDDFIVKDGRVVLTFKAAKKLGDDWRRIPDNNQVCKELEQRGWLDDTGNLTKYRSAAPPEMGNWNCACLSVQIRSWMLQAWRIFTDAISAISGKNKWVEVLNRGLGKG